ncbi:MAG: stage III sporulation protein AE [Eubacteriales bacterium]
MERIRCIFIAVVLMFMMGQAKICYASEESQESITEELEQQIIGQLDTSEIEAIIGDVFIDDKIKFSELLTSVLKGDYEEINEMAYQYIVTQFFYELSYNRATLIHIVLLTVFASIFTNFSSAFGEEQIASLGFYILYLMLLIISLQSFQVMIESITGNVENVLLFMSALCPVYFLTVAIASGQNSAIVFYNLSLLYIYVVELLVVSVVLPLTNAFIVIQVLNYLTDEKRLSKLAELVKKTIGWILKLMLAGVIGLNVIQGLIAPMMDNVQQSIWLRSAEAIPIVGDAMSGTGEVVLGTLKLIKNGVGVVGLILCIGITIGPIIQMSILTFLYKFVAAVVEPVADKRISGCLNCVGDGCEILLKTIMGVSVLFLITIAVVAATTS